MVNTAQYKSSAGKWVDLKTGQALSSEDMIKTSGKSLVVVKFTDNSVLKGEKTRKLRFRLSKKTKMSPKL
ncbi:MAG: hypothetical protein IPG53_03155 [Ignavibacteriales bacterium]|nr:hypothetical protein [Ignavibacteriales bacterium]